MSEPNDIGGLRPSVPRTPTQAVLRIVSIIMGVIGAAVAVGGVVVLALNEGVGMTRDDLWAVATFGAMIVVVAGLLMLTAALGLVASNDSARVEPYRFLCYLVGLAALVAIAWGWGLGTFILFNPVVLTVTIVYVLVCSRLADKVKEEHDAGTYGETFLRSRHQRVLHLLSEVLVVKGVLGAVVTVVLLAALIAYGEGTHAVVSGVSVVVSVSMVTRLLVGALFAVVDVVVGCLGVRGSNRPERVGASRLAAALACAVDFVRVALSVTLGGVFGVSFDVVFDLLFMGACAYLAFRVGRQPAPGELLAESVGAATAAPTGEEES